MRLMAHRASLPQRLMLEHKRPRLLPVATRTPLVHSRHRQSTMRFKEILPMRIVALHAAQLPLQHRVPMRQPQLRVRLDMAFQTSPRVLARIQNEPLSPPASLGMQTARPMTGFAPRLPCHPQPLLAMVSAVRTGAKHLREVPVTLGARLVAHVTGPGDRQRHRHRPRDRSTGGQRPHPHRQQRHGEPPRQGLS